jgi:hypothetical protein
MKLSRILSIVALLVFPSVDAYANSSNFSLLGASSATSSYVGPGNLASYKAWYGLRAYNTNVATTGNMPIANFLRISDSHTCDITVAPDGSGGIGNTANCSTPGDNGQTASAFCNATTCTLATLYDQTGHGFPIAQTTAANQPPIVFNCVGTKPCWQMTSATIGLITVGTYTPATGVLTWSIIADRTVGTGVVRWLQANTTANSISSGGANVVVLEANSVTFSAAMSDNHLHAITAVVNGASSVINIDGVETTGTVGASTTGAALRDLGAAATTAHTIEMGVVDNVAASSSLRTSLCQNEQAFYISSNFGAVC